MIRKITTMLVCTSFVLTQTTTVFANAESFYSGHDDGAEMMVQYVELDGLEDADIEHTMENADELHELAMEAHEAGTSLADEVAVEEEELQEEKKKGPSFIGLIGKGVKKLGKLTVKGGKFLFYSGPKRLGTKVIWPGLKATGKGISKGVKATASGVKYVAVKTAQGTKLVAVKTAEAAKKGALAVKDGAVYVAVTVKNGTVKGVTVVAKGAAKLATTTYDIVVVKAIGEYLIKKGLVNGVYNGFLVPVGKGIANGSVAVVKGARTAVVATGNGIAAGAKATGKGVKTAVLATDRFLGTVVVKTGRGIARGFSFYVSSFQNNSTTIESQVEGQAIN
ncbi:MAG: hypothetical protein COT74_02695 [Bdellovibrionales bacterium CG10_big_fil_rev_8_21_14_0_10_45_34]|nr:MAG: hypothetical protein COT74_02695 [Bdellovibrionales bacterium CG10_big_fil_rev_8_21_14_0_10_45_34]